MHKQNKRQLVKIALIVTVVALLQAMPCHAANPSELTGQWFATKEANVLNAVIGSAMGLNETQLSASADMELFKDGTGVFNKKRLNWKVENKRFVFIWPSKMEVYDYKISNGKLILTNGIIEATFVRKAEFQRLMKSALEKLKKEQVELKKKKELEDAEWAKKIAEEEKKEEEKKRIEEEERKKKELEIAKKVEEEKRQEKQKKRAEDEERKRIEEEENRRLEQISSYFTDPRDGKKYRTVKIGTQTWMAQNLDYAGKNDDVGKCYNKDPENCKKYGTLYTSDEAEKICPSGWHLPSDNEWKTLINFVGGNKIAGKKLKTKMGWHKYKCKYTTEEKTGRGNIIVTEHDECATDEFGFSALPGGSSVFGDFTDVGSIGDWWISNEDETWSMGHYTAELGSHRYGSDFLASVRCLKN